MRFSTAKGSPCLVRSASRLEGWALGWHRRAAGYSRQRDGVYQFRETRAGHVRCFDTGGSGAVVLTAPDGPCVLEHQEDLIDELSKTHRVIAFDMPGNGFSYQRADAPYTLEHLSGVMLDLLDSFRVPTVALCFSCVNGLAALRLASTAPDRVSQVILSQTPSFDSMVSWVDRNIPPILQTPFAGQLVNTLTARTLSDRWYERALPKGAADLEAFQEKSRTALNSGGCFCLASLVQGVVAEGGATLAEVHAPVLAIHGTHDHSHKGTDFRSLATLVPEARFLSFSGCGHFPDLENVNRFGEAFRDFTS